MVRLLPDDFDAHLTIAELATVIDDVECVQTSFPTFVELINTLAGGPAITVEQ